VGQASHSDKGGSLDKPPIQSRRHPGGAQPRQGRPSLAQRFSAGNSGKNDLSPGGTTQFSRTLFSAAITGLFSVAALAAEVKMQVEDLKPCLSSEN
jgi:hypothetical protein